MSDVIVHFSIDRMDAEVAASALRAERLHPRIAPDITSSRFGAGSVTTAGRWLVYVPELEERQAREILGEPLAGDEPEDNPVLRMVVIVAIIAGLLLATPFVAQVCYAAR